MTKEELEKENAELKSIADFQTSSNMDRYFQLKRSKEQLTTAKGLLRAWFQYCIDTKGKTPLKIETAQFLEDSEVEK